MVNIKIFISSPGDVGQERLLTQRVIERLQGEFKAYVKLEPIMWEHEPLKATEHFQNQIILPSSADIVVCILWSRLGTRLPKNFVKEDGTPYSSGTEWEFEDAAKAYREKRIPDLLVYRKMEEPPIFINDSKSLFTIEQKKALDSFLNRWFGSPQNGFTAAFHSFNNLDEYEERLGMHLRKLILKRIPEHKEKDIVKLSWYKGSPYRGLESFDFEHSEVFHGRTKDIGKIKEALIYQASLGCSFLLVLGMSGCGKSSLIKAGVLPNITCPGVIEGVGFWRFSIIRPGNFRGRLLHGLSESLFSKNAFKQKSEEQISLVEQMLNNKPDEIADYIKEQLSEISKTDQYKNLQGKFVIVVDQMEELFTDKKISDDEKEKFIQALYILSKSKHAFVIGSMRSDFYHKFTENSKLMEMKGEKGQYDLLPPSFTQICQMIKNPTLAAGLKFEEDVNTGESLDDILEDVASKNPGALPLLEFTLEELYKRKTEENVLTFDAYKGLGGLEGALSCRAEEILLKQDEKVKASLTSIFRKLITVDVKNEDIITAVRVPYKRLISNDDEKQLVEAFLEGRLFVSDRMIDGEVVIGVAHEALLTNWPRIKKLFSEDREFLRTRARVEDAQKRWIIEGKTEDFLLSNGKPLAEAEYILNTRKEDLNEGIITYIYLSIKKYKKARIRKNLAVVFAFSIILCFSIFSLYEWRNSVKQTNIANEQRKEAVKQTSIAEKNELEAKKQSIAAENERKNAEQQKNIAVEQRNIAEERKIYAEKQENIAEERKIYAQSQEKIALSQKKIAVLERDEALKTQSLFLSDLSNQKNNAGDTVTGMLLAIKALPKDLKNPERPFVKEAQQALYNNFFNYRQTKIIPAHDSSIGFVKYTKDGKYIVTSSQDGTIKIWNTNNNEIFRIIKEVKGSSKNEILKISYTDISGDSKYVAATYDDMKVRIYEIETGKLANTLIGNTGMILSVSFSLNSRYIMTTSYDYSLKVWDVSNGKQVKNLRFDAELYSANFSKDSKHIVTVGKMNPITIWNLYDDDSIELLEGHGGKINYVNFSPDGKYIVSASDDNTVRIGSISEKKCIAVLRGHTGEVYGAYFNDDGKKLLTVSNDETARVWNMEDFTQNSSLMGHNDSVTFGEFTSDDKYILTKSQDRSIGIWNAKNGENLGFVSGFGDTVMGMDVSSDGKYVAVGGYNGVLTIFAIEKQEMVSFIGLDIDRKKECVSPDGNYLVTTCDNNNAQIIDIKNKKIVNTLEHKDFVSGATYSHDGNKIVTSTYGEGKVTIWDKSGKIVKEINTDPNNTWIYSPIFSPDDRYIAVTDGSNSVYIYDTTNGGNFINMSFGGHKITGEFIFSPNSKNIAIVGEDDAIYLYNIGSGKLNATLRGNNEYISCIAYSPDGKRLVSTSLDYKTIIWDTETGRALNVLKENYSTINDLSISSDGKKLITASYDGSARVWNLETAEPILTLKENDLPLENASFSEDNKRIMTVSTDFNIYIYEADTGTCIASIKALKGAPSYSLFTPDGEYIITSSQEFESPARSAVKVWHILSSSDKLLEYVNNILPINDRHANIELLLKYGKSSTVLPK